VFAIKGGTQRGKPLVARPSRHNRYRVPLFVLCVDSGKDTVFSRLRRETPGPGYMHLPDWVDQEYVDQLTAEKAIRKYVKGRGAVKEWVKLRERNEALDLEVYCLAALYILGTGFTRQLPERAAEWSKSPEAVAALAATPSQPSMPFVPRRRGWMGGWRGTP